MDIKFRAWHKTDKVMWTPDEFDEREYLMIGIDGQLLGVDSWCWDGCSNYDSWEEGNPWTVMQYIGLKDKNEKEIYEKDIVVSEFGFAYVCKYTGNAFGFHHKGGAIFTADTSKLEVIGNACENPELVPSV